MYESWMRPMKPVRPASPEAYTLQLRFNELREALDRSDHQNKLNRPLGYWALPRDRRLPYALLDRTLTELIGTAFADISATPGIGPKKVASLVMPAMWWRHHIAGMPSR